MTAPPAHPAAAVHGERHRAAAAVARSRRRPGAARPAAGPPAAALPWRRPVNSTSAGASAAAGGTNRSTVPAFPTSTRDRAGLPARRHRPAVAARARVAASGGCSHRRRQRGAQRSAPRPSARCRGPAAGRRSSSALSASAARIRARFVIDLEPGSPDAGRDGRAGCRRRPAVSVCSVPACLKRLLARRTSRRGWPRGATIRHRDAASPE